MDTILVPLLQTIYSVLSLYVTVILIAVVVSLMVSFNVLNTSNRLVYIIADVLNRLTEPAFAFFRRLIPPFGSMDLSPLFLMLLINFIQRVIIQILMKL